MFDNEWSVWLLGLLLTGGGVFGVRLAFTMAGGMQYPVMLLCGVIALVGVALIMKGIYE